MHADFFNGVEVVLLNEGTEYPELNTFQGFGQDAIVLAAGADRRRSVSNPFAWVFGS